jgi:hypothetical protein
MGTPLQSQGNGRAVATVVLQAGLQEPATGGAFYHLTVGHFSFDLLDFKSVKFLFRVDEPHSHRLAEEIQGQDKVLRGVIEPFRVQDKGMFSKSDVFCFVWHNKLLKTRGMSPFPNRLVLERSL